MVTTAVLGLYHLPVSFIYFLIVTSWSNGLVWYLPQLLRFQLVTAFRALQVTRTVHGYGVFHPKSLPPLKHTPVFEGSDDGKTWLQYVGLGEGRGGEFWQVCVCGGGGVRGGGPGRTSSPARECVF